jgi:hypothetical protein
MKHEGMPTGVENKNLQLKNKVLFSGCENH